MARVLDGDDADKFLASERAYSEAEQREKRGAKNRLADRAEAAGEAMRRGAQLLEMLEKRDPALTLDERHAWQIEDVIRTLGDDDPLSRALRALRE